MLRSVAFVASVGANAISALPQISIARNFIIFQSPGYRNGFQFFATKRMD
jgi:hypothetical protein